MSVLCLGAGRMGSQIGVEYALGGHSVAFVVRRMDRAQARVQAALDTVARYRLAPETTVEAARSRMSFRDAVTGEDPVELVVESLPEDRAVKIGPLREAAERWPQATIATNTSSIGISELGRLASVSERIVATHYWNPPLLMPLVEMLGGERTPADRVQRLATVLRDLGKRPVLLGSEVPGMLWNRLQLALLRECLWLVEHGVATPEQIDEVVRDGLARRWRLLGPFETVSLGGAAVFDAIAENLFPVLSDATAGRFGPYLERDPEALAELASRRDLGLASELEGERTRPPG
jgi:3-hydroxybutyryl-CoA dehydrogenase